jgi:hypothetical protein
MQEKFSWEKIARQTEALYRQLEQPRAAAPSAFPQRVLEVHPN